MIKYIGSQGEVIDLQSDKIRASHVDFHEFMWKTDVKRVGFGHKVAFSKEPRAYKVSVNFRGDMQERVAAMNEFIDVLERDVITKSPATICVNDMYVKGYATSCKSGPSSDNGTWSCVEFEFFCENPLWTQEELFSFSKISAKSQNNKRYKNRYSYRYASATSESVVVNRSKKDSNFLLRIYGPATNPSVDISGHRYSVNAALATGERLEVDTRKKTVEKVSIDGVRENIFHLRAKKQSIFKKLQSGTSTVKWNGQFAFDVVVLNERSEPRW